MADDSTNCCFLRQLPPPVASNYTPKGQTEKFSLFDVYITGNTSSSTRGVVMVHDAFGLYPTTLQGADRLAESLDAVVVFPDFFKGNAPSLSLYPPDTDEKKERLQHWMQTVAKAPEHYSNLLTATQEAKEKFPTVQNWGAFGLCWGGKLSIRVSGPDSPFSAAGTAHPSWLDKKDAEALTIPYICLFSSEDGTPELVKEYTEALTAKGEQNQIETYGTMIHGWMGARARLEEEENAKAFEKGYNQVASFFQKHL